MNFNAAEYGLVGVCLGVLYFITRDLIGVIRGRRENGNGSQKMLRSMERFQRDLAFEEKIANTLEKQAIILEKICLRLESLEESIVHYVDGESTN